MLSHHHSGLSVIAAPNRPAEMRSFDPSVVTRLLDLVSANFDYVVIDMPRTWFSWTDSILQGSNRLFIVSEMTVPGLRFAKQLLSAIRERLGDGASPQVIVNRFEQRMFSHGLKRGDIEKALGPAFGGAIPNNYRIVREAIDRGIPLEDVKPGNNVAAAVRKLVVPQTVLKGPKKDAAASKSGSWFGKR
jgi:pilus assembly protein CpaE